MTRPPLIGRFSKYLTDRHHRDVVNETLTEVVRFERGLSAVYCLPELLDHLLRKGICDASFGFAVDRDGAVKEVITQTNKLAENLEDQIQDVLRRKSSKWWQSTAAEPVRVFYEKDLQRVFGKSLPAEIKHAIMVKTRLPPTLKNCDRDIIVFFFNVTVRLDATFLGSWLEVLLPIWSDAFTGKQQAFERCVQRFIRDSTASNVPGELFEKARHAHPWLSSSDVFRACEALLARDTPLPYSKIEGEVESFCKEWHSCADRPWPCDSGHGRDCALMTWLPWRLEQRREDQDRLRAATEASRNAVKQALLPSARLAGSVDSILDATVLLHVLQAVEDKTLRLPSVNTEAYTQAKQHLGRFAATVLCGTTPTPDSVEAMIWTISEYAYQVLGVDRRLHLASHMRHGARGEASLHMMREFYRDHFFHTLEVCFLGQLLLLAEREEGTIERAFALSDDSLRQWYVAALLHDIGYAVDISKGLKDWLGFFASESFLTLAEGIGAALKGMGDSEAFEQFCQSQDFKLDEKPWEDHGLVGAHHLHTLVMNLDKKDGIHRTDEAVKAIAKHNCDNITIDYDKEPLSALLVLCDVLQAWRRPHFRHFSMGPAWMLSMLMGSQPPQDLPEPIRASLQSNLQFKERAGDVIPQFTPPLVLRLVYGQEVNHDSCVFNIWLDMTRSLQRIDFRNFPFDILVQVDTPTYTPRKAKTPKTQMGRLFDAARETHMDYLEKWFPRDEQNGIPGVGNTTCSSCRGNRICYHVEYEERESTNVPCREMLSFNLKQMNGRGDLMTEDVSRFRSDLPRWKKYREDRSAVGDYSPWRHSKQ